MSDHSETRTAEGWPAWGRASKESLVESLRLSYCRFGGMVEVYAGLGRGGRRQRRMVGNLGQIHDGTSNPRWTTDLQLLDWIRARLGDDAHIDDCWPTLIEAKEALQRAASGRPRVEFGFAIDPIAPDDIRTGRSQPVLAAVDVCVDSNAVGQLVRIGCQTLPDGSEAYDRLEASADLAAWLADRGIPDPMLRWSGGLDVWASVLRLALGHEAAERAAKGAP